MNKITVDRQLIENARDCLRDAEIYVNTCSEEKRRLVKETFNGLTNMLKANPIAGENARSTVSMDEYGRYYLVGEGVKTSMHIPAPRCDGCEYQHSYLENLSIDELNGRVLCNRNINPPFYKDGIQMFFEPGQGVMVCSVWKWQNNGLVKIKESQPSTDYERVAKFMDKELGDETELVTGDNEIKTDKRPDPKNALITPEELVEIIKEGQKIYAAKSPEGFIVGEQRQVNMDGGTFIVEWTGYEWVKKYIVSEVTRYNGQDFVTRSERSPIVPEPIGNTKPSDESEYTKAYKITEIVNRQAIVEILEMLSKFTQEADVNIMNAFIELHNKADDLKTKLTDKQ